MAATPVRTPARASRPLKVLATSLGANLAVLSLLCLGLVLLVGSAAPFSTDETLYRTQVTLLREGSWGFAWPGAGVDPEFELVPYTTAQHNDSQVFPYVSRPLYPLLLAAVSTLAGEGAGLLVVPAAGLVGGAAAGWVLTRRLFPGAEALGFWFVAVGPAAVDATLVWAHAPAAAVGGWATVSAVTILDGRRFTLGVVGLLACAALGPLVRAELLLYVVALCVALVIVALASRNRIGLTAAVSALAALVSVVALQVNSWWRSAVVGEELPEAARSGGGDSYLAGRLEGAVNALVRGDDLGRLRGVVALLALVLVAIGVLAALRGRGRWTVIVVATFSAAAVSFAIRAWLHPDTFVTGLLAAWPLALLGLLVLERVRSDRAIQVLVVGCVAFVLAVVVTQYDVAGGLEWGGRFLRPLAVPLAALAAGGALALWRASGEDRRVVLAAMVAVALAPTFAGLVAVAETRERNGTAAEALEVLPAGSYVTSRWVLPHLALPPDTDVTWYYVADSDDLEQVASGLSSALGEPVTLIGTRDDDLPGAPVDPPAAIADAGLQLHQVGPT